MIELLKELVENKIIQNELEIIFKSGKKIHGLIENLSVADMARWIKIFKLTEILEKLEDRVYHKTIIKLNSMEAIFIIYYTKVKQVYYSVEVLKYPYCGKLIELEEFFNS